MQIQIFHMKTEDRLIQDKQYQSHQQINSQNSNDFICISMKTSAGAALYDSIRGLRLFLIQHKHQRD